jgi:hypothetical protein
MRPLRGVGATSRMHAMLLVLRRLALAVAALVVCAGVAAPSRAAAGFVAPAAVKLVACESAGREVMRASRLHPQDDAARRAIDLNAVELDDDDDDTDGDDPLCAVSEGALPFPSVPLPRNPGRAVRSELPTDTSRFAAGPGLPRGPPAPARRELDEDRRSLRS